MIENIVDDKGEKKYQGFYIAKALSSYDISGGNHHTRPLDELEPFDPSYKTMQRPASDYNAMPELGYNAAAPQQYINSNVIADYLGIHRH